MKAKTLPCIHSYKDLPKKLTSYASSTHKLMISGLIMLYATHKAMAYKLTDNERLRSFSESKHI